MSANMCADPQDVHGPRGSPHVHLETMMCQCRFVDCNKGTSLVGVVDNRGGSAGVGAGGVWKIPVPSAQYCCEPRNKVYLKKKK